MAASGRRRPRADQSRACFRISDVIRIFYILCKPNFRWKSSLSTKQSEMFRRFGGSRTINNPAVHWTIIKMKARSKSFDSNSFPSDEDCRISVPYLELEGSKLSLEDELPPPKYYRRSTPCQNEVVTKKLAPKLPTLILSLVKPHKILAVSKEACDFLGYGEEEISGRSVSMLQGPKTDTAGLCAAIKNTGVLSSGEFSTVIYARDGSELKIAAALVPYIADGGKLAGCKLQLILDNASESDDVVERLAKWTGNAEKGKRSQHRAHHNFCTGLTIQLSMQHRTASHRSTPQPAPWE